MLLEAANEGSIGTRVIADPDNAATGRMLAGLALFVEEVQAVRDPDVGGLRESGVRVQRRMHGAADLFRIRHDNRFRCRLPVPVRQR